MVKKIPDDCLPACQFCSFAEIEKKEDIGYCRRYPPIVISSGDNEYETTYPIVGRTDWCGEFHRFSN